MPWAPDGETVTLLARWKGSRASLHEGLPDGFRPLPGPCAVSCTRSWGGGGPLVELRLLIPVRVGKGLHWWTALRVVDAVSGGTGTLTWTTERDRHATRVVHWIEQDVTVRARPGRIAVPIGGGWGRIARAELIAPARSRLAPLAGRHRGVVVGTPSSATGLATATTAAASSLPLTPIGRPVIGGASPAVTIGIDGSSLRIDRADLALVSTLPVGTGA